jgi:DNA-binding winged helix-turn-helix (wHTH) protein
MKPSLLGLLPSYADAAMGEDPGGGTLKRALSIAAVCVWERRLPGEVEGVELHQIGRAAGEAGISQSDLQAGRLLCGVIGFGEVCVDLERTDIGRSLVGQVRLWFHAVMPVVGHLMDEGLARAHIVGMNSLAGADHTTDLRGQVAAWLRERKTEIVWRTARHVIASGVFGEFQARPGFAIETRAWLDASVILFVLILEQGRLPSATELDAICAYCTRGDHADVPVHLIEAGLASAADLILHEVTNQLLEHLPELATSGLMGEIVARAVHLRENLIRGVEKSRSHVSVSPFIRFDPQSRVLFIKSGRGASLRLSRREGQTLSLLVAAKGRPISVEQLAQALTGDGAQSVDLHSVHATVSRLRGRLRPVALSEAIVSHRGHGYLWQGPSNA